MRKLFSLAISLLALEGAILASEGKQASSRSNADASSVPSSQRGKPGPIAYAIAFNPVDPFGGTQFGFLDIGTDIPGDCEPS